MSAPSPKPRLQLWLAAARLGLQAVARSPLAWLASGCIALGLGSLGELGPSLLVAAYAAVVSTRVHRAVHSGLFRAAPAEARTMLAGLSAGASVPAVLASAAGAGWFLYNLTQQPWRVYQPPALTPLGLLTPALVAGWLGTALGWVGSNRNKGATAAFLATFAVGGLAELFTRFTHLYGDAGVLGQVGFAVASGQVALAIAARRQPPVAGPLPPEVQPAPQLEVGQVPLPQPVEPVFSEEAAPARPARERVR